MADRDDTRSGQGVKAYPRGKSQGGRAVQAVSRKMQENDGVSGHRTIVRETPEGRAIARTRDGMPMVEVEKYGELPYMETGRLEYTIPGELNPARLLPAKWRFMDVDPNGDYLGEIYTGAISDEGDVGEQVVPQPIPPDAPNPGTLRDNIDSLAIGYERGSTPAKDAEIAEKLMAKTLLKKIVVGAFPSSLWTGKMRLFVQAQYGGKEESDSWRFVVEMTEASTYLRYSFMEKDVRYQMAMGMWAHSTPGIFAPGDGTFWCINITRPTGNLYRVNACRLVPDEDFVDDLIDEYKRLKSISASDLELSKVEGYIFAHSKIDLAKMREIGQYNAGTDAGAIAYGWKFNGSGSKASIVVVKENGESPDEHLISTTIHLDFTYTPVPGQKPSTYWLTVAGSHEDSQAWVDPWASGNHIWVPEFETSIRSKAFSIAAGNAGVRQDCYYSGVPFYGYYRDDVWRPATVGFSEHGPEYRQSSSGLVFRSDADVSNVTNNYVYGTYLAGNGFTYESISSSGGSKTPLSFDGYSHDGTLDNGIRTTVASVPGAIGAMGSDETSIVVAGLYQTGSGWRNENPDGAPGYTEAVAREGFYPYNFGLGEVFIAMERMEYHLTRITRDGALYKAWAFVVPAFDAEAAYIAKSEYDNTNSCVRETKTADGHVYQYHPREVDYAGGTGARHPIRPWQAAEDMLIELSTTDGDYTSESITAPTSFNGIKCFNSEAAGIDGAPSVSFASLFTPLVTYQFIDNSMTMTTSFNGRYKGSEDIEQPSGETGSNLVPNFIGWV